MIHCGLYRLLQTDLKLLRLAQGYLIYRFKDIKTTNDVYILATKYSHEIGYVIIAVTVLIVGFLIYKGAKQKK